MHSAVNNHISKEKQITLIDFIALRSLITTLERNIGQILRASSRIIKAISRIKTLTSALPSRITKNSNGRTDPIRKPTSTIFVKHCSFCQRNGHIQNEGLNPQRCCFIRTRLQDPRFGLQLTALTETIYTIVNLMVLLQGRNEMPNEDAPLLYFRNFGY